MLPYARRCVLDERQRAFVVQRVQAKGVCQSGPRLDSDGTNPRSSGHKAMMASKASAAVFKLS